MRETVRFAVMSLALLAGCKAAAPPAAEASSAPSPSVAAAVALPSASPASEEQFIALGTEPFWNAKIGPGTIVYSTPEELAGQAVAVTENRQRASRIYAGTLGGQPFVLSMREASCSDGMSDRSYRFEVELAVGGGKRQGCAEPGTAFKAE